MPLILTHMLPMHWVIAGEGKVYAPGIQTFFQLPPLAYGASKG